MSKQIHQLHNMIVNMLESQNSVVKAVKYLTDRCADLECTTTYLQGELSGIKNGTLKDPTTMLKSTLSYIKNKYEISLLMNTELILKRFEELLDDSTFNDGIVNYMTKLNDNSIKLSAKNVISSFLTKDIAVKYTAVRSLEGKRISSFDFPKLYECFKETVRKAKYKKVFQQD
ncbi:uncharacterized protein LOC122859565 [Aphidius gifuensis]|uniref:uncharacterized protein LOC122859565 n=1 Tax=Aphidius gifuensis TaxID=684658 RepID=UPI001CDD4F83|nr:uncharacterized protein LOC122859565 [Aphidius gifuensis]XP_044019169.1 uncharacterized protein LOC122859565 [Aphidius gifuensis]XP_044019170.1 uncharacterized protein LOC122859565 [Aphidius gifuensis]